MLQKVVQLDNTDADIIIQMLWETEVSFIVSLIARIPDEFIKLPTKTHYFQCYIQGEAKYELQQLARFLSMKPTTVHEQLSIEEGAEAKELSAVAREDTA